MPTKRENLQTVLDGGEPVWVPFALNFAQWFRHHQANRSLPRELRPCATYVQAMKALGCDIFSRNLDAGFRERDTRLTVYERDTPASTGLRRTLVYATPYGDLRMVRQEQTALTTSYEAEHFVKDWARDGDACRYVLDQRAYDWDEAAFLAVDAEIGDDGLVNVPVAGTPLKLLHQFFGLAEASLFVMDHPAVAHELCDGYWARLEPVLRRLARHPRVASVILMDNVDTPFYPPALAARYWTPYVKAAAALMHAAGKHLFVHACGKLAGLAPVFAACRVSGLEGIAHPPLGDWTAPQAQACHANFIYVGGFGAHEQEAESDAAVAAFYADYLPRASRSRFIFSAACQTSIRTSWARILQVRDICRAWGGAPPGGAA